ncbi:MAG: glycosyltransferase family 4 protein [Desulfobacteraceae bacterium]|nr:glycosyltransferase family 4 protein [Desulfobacteraceae bacterium]
MNILFLNKFFYLQGGSERVLFEEMAILKEKNHKVIPFSRKHPDNISSEYGKYFANELSLQNKISFKTIKNIKEIIYSKEAKRCLKKLIHKKSIDIAHAHNIYGLLTTSVLDELHSRSIPTVLTLHDYKIICPNYQLFCNGSLCEDCKPNKYYKTVINNCVHGNIFYSIIYALENYFNFITRKYIKNVTKFIAVSKFIKAKFIEFGFPEQQIIHIPNFINTQIISPDYIQGDYILYFGRLSKEKGIKTLIDAFIKLKSNTLRLVVVGTGPLQEKLMLYTSKQGIKNVEFKGYLTGSKLEKAIQESKCIVVPSEWYENCPMSVLETLAYGKPVIGANIGGIPELIDRESDGLIFKSGDSEDLTVKIETLMSYSNEKLLEMGKHGRNKIENHYNAENHYSELINLYQSLIDNNEKYD